MPTSQLILGEHTLLTWSGSFTSPLPLVLFDRDELMDGRFVTSSSQALERLDQAGFTYGAAKLLSFALAELASHGETTWLTADSVALAGLAPDGLLIHVPESGAVGFEERFPHLDVEAIQRDTNLAIGDVRCVLAWLWYRACLEDSSDELVYDVSELAPDKDPEGWADGLWKARPTVSEEALGALVARPCTQLAAGDSCLEVWRHRPDYPESWPDALCKPPIDDGALPALPDWVPAGLAAEIPHLVVAPTASAVATLLEALEPGDAVPAGAIDLLIAAIAADRSIQPDTHATFWNKSKEVATRLWTDGERPGALLVLRALVWRAPKQGARDALDIVGTPVPDELADVIRQSFGMQRSPDASDGDWRADVIRLGSTLIDQGDARVALQLMRSAADVSHPSEAVKKALRARLETVYGLQLLDEGDPALAPFLLLGKRPPGSDDRADLARLLYDAIVGAVYEPLLDDDAERNAWFESRIAPGLAYLEADPTPGGGRRRLGPARDDTSGPGLGMAMVFLLILAALFVGIGLVLRLL